MVIPVLIEPIAGGGFRAVAGSLSTLSAEGASQDEALDRLRDEIQLKLSAGASLVPLDIPPAERASILTLKEAMCHWPIGDPGEEEFHFCGRKTSGSLPYCEHHARLAYQAAPTRRREKSFAFG